MLTKLSNTTKARDMAAGFADFIFENVYEFKLKAPGLDRKPS